MSDLAQRLERAGQKPVLRFLDQLDNAGKERLMQQLAGVDLDALPALVAEYVTGRYVPPIPASFEPAYAMPREPQTAEQKTFYARARARGQELLRAGKVGAFLVAGGQGTRLGYEGPKGEYPVTPLRNKPLFQVFAEQLLAHSRMWGKAIPWYIMTSDANDAATRTFFEKHAYFGLDRSTVFFFQQGMMPAFAMDGTMLLAEKSSLALSPGGNGDCFRSLAQSGALGDMQKRGVEQLAYFAVDNPMVRCVDPLFIGLNDVMDSDMASKAIPKAAADERVGNFVIGDGQLQVIEYSDMPAGLATAKTEDGALKFNSASIGIHVIRVSFIDRLNSAGGVRLPWHRAEKKVLYVDDVGNAVKPEQPNAVKLEQFVFDALPLGKNPIILTTERSEEFSPVKNAQGIDSPATSRRDQIRRAARWLENAGVVVERDSNGEVLGEVEISALYAVSGEQLAERKPAISRLAAGERIYLSENGIERL